MVMPDPVTDPARTLIDVFMARQHGRRQSRLVQHAGAQAKRTRASRKKARIERASRKANRGR